MLSATRCYKIIFWKSPRHILACCILLVCAVCYFTVTAGTAKALDSDIVPANLVRINTPVHHPNLNNFKPLMGKYRYEVSWQGIPAAEASLSVEPDKEGLRLVASAKTVAAIDVLYKLRYTATSVIGADDFLPRWMQVDYRENSRNKQTRLVFDEDGRIESVRWQKNKGNVDVLTFYSGNFTLDPFSAVFMARSLDWQIGHKKAFDAFNGKVRYLIELLAVDRVKIMANGEMRDTWVIVPKVQNLSLKVPTHKLREAKIYLSADDRREVLKVVSSVFIGSVTTKLVEFIPSANDFPHSMQLAKK